MAAIWSYWSYIDHLSLDKQKLLTVLNIVFNDVNDCVYYSDNIFWRSST